MLQKPILPLPKDIPFKKIEFMGLDKDSEESIMSQGLPPLEALKFLEKAIDDGVFENTNSEDEC